MESINREDFLAAEEELGSRMHDRFEELMREGKSKDQADTIIRNEFSDYLQEYYRQKSILSEQRDFENYKPEEISEDDDLEDEYQEPEEEIQKEPTEDSYTKTRRTISEGVKSAEDIGKGIVGVGSRKPIKEALISGAARVVEAIKGEPKTPQEIAREKKFRAEEEHARKMAEIKARKYRKEYQEERPLSISDFGRGSMGTSSYFNIENPVKDIDFLETKSHREKTHISKSKQNFRLKPKIEKKRKILRPPSTEIPFGGRNPPSTRLSGAGRPPSVSFGIGKSSIEDIIGIKKSPKNKFKDKTKKKKISHKNPKKIEEKFLGLEGYF